MIALGIESTAHTFGVGIVECTPGINESFKILVDVKDVYKAPPGSGIHPRDASRHHMDVCDSVIGTALKTANIRFKDIDLIAYSAGPGLGPCLRVGAVAARAMASYYGKPLVSTNHAIGHIELGKFLCNLSDPLVVIVSGGHTALAAKVGSCWKIFGETLDLTLGQLLDQLGRYLGLSSPAGPAIENLALQAQADPKLVRAALSLNLPYTVKGNDVSYSGLLSAAKMLFDEKKATPEAICYAVQEIAFASLIEAAERALSFTEKSELLVTGGVAANQRLSSMFKSMCDSRGVKAGIIPRQYSGDCGTQIAAASFEFYRSHGAVKYSESSVRQSWRIDTVCL